MTVESPAEQLERMVQFFHYGKTLAQMPGLSDELLATLFGLDLGSYNAIRDCSHRTRAAASGLLAEPDFAARVDRLPFAANSTIVGLGDSITDDLQSWLEILRHLLDLRRPSDAIQVVNAGISGETTSQMVSRFLGVVARQPAWIICMAGTNDARTHGTAPIKTPISIDETERNLAALRNFAATQTAARWLWLTPARHRGADCRRPFPLLTPGDVAQRQPRRCRRRRAPSTRPARRSPGALRPARRPGVPDLRWPPPEPRRTEDHRAGRRGTPERGVINLTAPADPDAQAAPAHHRGAYGALTAWAALALGCSSACPGSPTACCCPPCAPT